MNIDTITSHFTENFVEIRINGLVHICWEKDEFVSLHSYISEKGRYIDYVIKVKFKTTSLRLGYDKKEKWEKILKLLTGI